MWPTGPFLAHFLKTYIPMLLLRCRICVPSLMNISYHKRYNLKKLFIAMVMKWISFRGTKDVWSVMVLCVFAKNSNPIELLSVFAKIVLKNSHFLAITFSSRVGSSNKMSQSKSPLNFFFLLKLQNNQISSYFWSSIPN